METVWPEVDVIKILLVEIYISQNLKCENNAILGKSILLNCLLLLKWHILAFLTEGEI